MNEGSQACGDGYARHRRERATRLGLRPGLALILFVGAKSDGRPQRSYALAPADTPPPQGLRPCTPWSSVSFEDTRLYPQIANLLLYVISNVA